MRVLFKTEERILPGAKSLQSQGDDAVTDAHNGHWGGDMSHMTPPFSTLANSIF